MPVRYATRRVNLSLIVDELYERRINVGLIAREPCNEESKFKFDCRWTLQLGDKSLLAPSYRVFSNNDLLKHSFHSILNIFYILTCVFHTLWNLLFIPHDTFHRLWKIYNILICIFNYLWNLLSILSCSFHRLWKEHDILTIVFHNLWKQQNILTIIFHRLWNNKIY